MALDDRRQCVEHRLEALTGRDQPEGREQEARLHPLVAARRRTGRSAGRLPASSSRRAAPSCVGAPCGTTTILSAAHASSSTSSRLPVSVITITRSASSQSAVKTCSWCGVGAESTVCNVTTSGCASPRTNDRTYSPSRSRRRSRTRAGAARRRRRCGRAPGQRGRSRRALPATCVCRISGRCGLDGSSRTTSALTSSTSGTSSNAFRTSKEKVPIPHARGGYVEKIAVRTFVRPFRLMPEAGTRAASSIGSSPRVAGRRIASSRPSGPASGRASKARSSRLRWRARCPSCQPLVECAERSRSVGSGLSPG